MMNQTKHRYYSLDILRGLAVLLMIASHSVYFFHTYKSPFLVGFEHFGNTIAFTIFLLISGAVTYIAYFKDSDHWPTRKKRFASRLFVVLISYYALAIFISVPNIVGGTFADRAQTIFNIFTFRTLPSYTEFIAPFFLFGLFTLFLAHQLKIVSRSIGKLILIGLVLYIGGFVLSTFRLPLAIEPWRALFAGGSGIYRFPLLQYAIVYLLGLGWGNLLINHSQNERQELSHSRFLLLISGATIAVALVAGFLLQFDISRLFLRWPPTLPFMALGVFAGSLITILLYRTDNIKQIPFIRNFLLLFGQNAFGLLVCHILLMQAYRISGGATYDSVFFVVVGLITVIIMSLALTTFIPFNFDSHLTSISMVKDKLWRQEAPLVEIGQEVKAEVHRDYQAVSEHLTGRHRRHRRRYTVIAAMSALILATIILPGAPKPTFSTIQTNLTTHSQWWDDSYTYRSPVLVTNTNTFNSLDAGSVVTLTVDHAKLVDAKKANRDGSDLKIATLQNNQWSEVPVEINNPDQSSTSLRFALPNQIRPNQKSSNIYLYYGNIITTPVKAPTLATTSADTKTVLETEESFPIMLELDRHWALKDVENTRKTIGISVTPPVNSKITAVTYRLSNSASAWPLSLNSDNQWTGDLDYSIVSPGTYQVQATITEGDNIKTSQKVGLFVSKPLYYAWTVDWEGIDAPNSNIDALGALSDRFNIPLTQLYNPRNYTNPDLSVARQQYIENWVKNRRDTKNDEIGLHLHMQYDFVRDAGVEPKTSAPNWGDKGDGYGSLTSNYNETEMTKILNRALWWFDQKGFAKPKIYRAGGWFANLDTLKALDDVGIPVDTSGRSTYKFPPNNPMGFWKLSANAQPFFPARDNMNSTSSDHLNVLEIPNNALDSYWQKSDELLTLFKGIYSGGVINDFRQATFVSHPHWFTKTHEQPTAQDMFTQLEHYTYRNDEGPLIYVTSSQIYNAFILK